MPSTSKSVGYVGGEASRQILLPVERGRLMAVTISQTEGTSVPGSLFAMIALCTQPASPGTIIAALAAGSFTVYSPLGWNGNLPLEPDMVLWARCKTFGTGTIKLSVLTEVD